VRAQKRFKEQNAQLIHDAEDDDEARDGADDDASSGDEDDDDQHVSATKRKR
jgi:hypothetical protein